VFKNEPDTLYVKPALMIEIKEVFRVMSEFNAFLNRAVEDAER